MTQRPILFTKRLLDLMFLCGIVMTASIPAVFSRVGRHQSL